jgi:transposase
MLYSLIESAKANGLEPKAYLNHLFEHPPVAKTEQVVIKLLPQNIQKSELVGLGK